MNVEILMIAGGALHFLILIVSVQIPRVLDWETHLALLPPFLRSLFWVYGAFIVLTIAGFGALSIGYAAEIAVGEGLARGFCAFVAIFWTARLFVQWVIFDPGPFLKTRLHRVGYHGLTAIFILLPLIYGYAALAN